MMVKDNQRTNKEPKVNHTVSFPLSLYTTLKSTAESTGASFNSVVLSTLTGVADGRSGGFAAVTQTPEAIPVAEPERETSQPPSECSHPPGKIIVRGSQSGVPTGSCRACGSVVQMVDKRWVAKE